MMCFKVTVRKDDCVAGIPGVSELYLVYRNLYESKIYKC